MYFIPDFGCVMKKATYINEDININHYNIYTPSLACQNDNLSKTALN